jgi:hypothetical protein
MKKQFAVLISILGLMFLISNNLWALELNTETNIVEDLAQKNSFFTDNPDHDPFKALISKPKIKMPEPINLSKSKNHEKKQLKKEIIKPLNIKITGICGNEKQRQAIIVYENKEMLVEAGNKIDNKFEIIEISPEQIVVYSINETRRKVFKIS